MVMSLHGARVYRGRKRLLGSASVDLASRGVTAVVGPNGSGKSTLLRLMHGLERLSGGEMEWHDKIAPRDQAFLFQTPQHLRRTVQENLAFPLKLRRRSKTLIKTKVSEAAHRFGLTPLLAQFAYDLSGGEQQRLALARAMITGPKLLFMDEPSANLDRISTQLIKDTVISAAKQGTRVFIASHSMAQVRRLADDVVFVDKGKCYGPFTTEQFIAYPTPKAAKEWLGDLDGHAAEPQNEPQPEPTGSASCD